MRLSPLLLAALLASSACTGAPQPPRAAPTGPNAPITEEELERSQAPDLYTAVRSLRPQWLTRFHAATLTQTSGITVYVNDYRYGGLKDLQNIPSNSATSVTFLSAAQAQYRYGVGNMHGAIAVVTTVAPLR
jgi:hypothetical protein